jgi:DNA-directed RNA polymerase subunit K/omega
MSFKYNRSGGSSYFGRGGDGSDEEDDDTKVKEGESGGEDSDGNESNGDDSNGDDSNGDESVISDDGAPNLDEVDEDEQGEAVAEGDESDIDVDEEGDAVEAVEENDSDDMTDAYDSDEDMESGEIDETKPVRRVPRVRIATSIGAAAVMGGPSSNPGIQALLDETIQSDESDEDADGEEESYLQKFNTEIKKNYVVDNHPECVIQNYHEIIALSSVVRDKYNNVIDGLHRTCPYLSKFEKTRVLGQRAMQINAGAPSFVKVPENIVDGYLIAEMELSKKKIPFIIRRPLPNGGSEYWKLSDLEDIVF